MGVIYTMSRKYFGLAAIASACFAVSASAATVTFAPVAMSVPSAEAVTAGAPPNASVNSYVCTTDADILSINRVGITLPSGQTLFNVAPPFGSDVEPPDPAFVGLNRSLEADSWITTPGATSLLGPGFPGDGTTSTWGDLVNSGPQTSFKFAQLTVPQGVFGTFTGRISVSPSAGVVEDFEFSLPINIPEPGTIALASFGLIGLVAARRRTR
jgi:PEP-CTERM motif